MSFIIDPDDILEAMLMYGGGFVSTLARLYRQGDDDNRRRLREAFPEYFQKYRELALLKRDQPHANPDGEHLAPNGKPIDGYPLQQA
jgi:hypothetical protein